MIRSYIKNIRVGDPFEAIVRVGKHSRTLGGEEVAGRIAFGRHFIATGIKENGVTAKDFFFSLGDFIIKKKAG